MTARGSVHLLIDPVGAGKSTFARRQQLRSAAMFLDLDSWMVRLFGNDDRPAEGVLEWYLDRRERCRNLMWDVTSSAVACSTDVFLELGLVASHEREAFYERVRAEDIALLVYLVEAPREVRRRRVIERNAAGGPFTQIVPPEFFERASDAWEPPSALERTRWNIIDV